jgi:hypothetical protein
MKKLLGYMWFILAIVNMSLYLISFIETGKFDIGRLGLFLACFALYEIEELKDKI